MTGKRDHQHFNDVVNRKNFVVLDTETTGKTDAEIVEIAIIDSTGRVLLNQVVKPRRTIPADATAIHGISNEEAENAPTWGEIAPVVYHLIVGRDVVIYNVNYDVNVLASSSRHAQVAAYDWFRVANYHCAMIAFAAEYGDWWAWKRQYKWQKLTKAAEYYGIKVENAHRALGDCLMTLEVCRKLAVNAEPVV